MSNVYTMIPKKPAQYNLVTKQERLVYVPLATRETAGIVKIGNGLNVTTEGLLSLDSVIYDNINNKVDKVFDGTSDYHLVNQVINNNENGLSLISKRGTAGINFVSTLISTLSVDTGLWEYTAQIKNNGEVTNSKTSLAFNKNNDAPYITYNKTMSSGEYAYSGEISTIPYVDYKVNDKATIAYVDESIKGIKRAVPYVFPTFVDFENWLIGKYIRPEDGATVDNLNIGDNIYVAETGVPDYWVKSLTKPFSLDNFVAYETGEPLPTVVRLEA